MTWVGWVRVPKGRWRRVCDGPTWGRCWDLLLAVRPGHLPSLEKVVLRRGVDPGKRKAGR